MDATKIKTVRSRLTTETRAGPGQNPPKPQPMPNSTEPMSKRLSTVFISGRKNLRANTGFALDVPPDVPTTPPPTPDDLDVIHRIDPGGRFTKQ